VISLAVKANRAWRNELKAPDAAKDVICKGRLEKNMMNKEFEHDEEL
jgi:hypothetical protein